MQIFPTEQGLARYSFDIDLEEVSYRFHFSWNERDTSWYFDITDTEDNQIVNGKRLGINSNLLLPRAAGSPPGTLFALDTSSDGFTEARYDDLGTRVIVYYVESTEEI